MSFALNYQAFLDKINNRVPIKWLTRPIDKIHPLASLILFVLIIAVILLLIFKPFGAVGEKEEYITFTIGLADSNGQLLKNFEFQLNDSLNGITQNYRTDSKGQTTVELNKFGDYSIIVDKKGYKYKDEIIDLSKTKQNFIVELFVLASIQEKSLRFVGTNGQAILESLNVTITCQDGSSIDPSTSTVTTGTSIFNVPVSCTKLVATAIGTNYSGQNIVINQETGIVTVPPKAINTSFGQATVKVKSGTNFLDGITLRVYKEGDSINPVTSGQSQFGSRRFPNLEVGNYIVVATDDSLRYQTAETEFIITKNIETQVSLELNAINTPVVPGDTVTTITTKDIRVIVKDEDTSLEIDGVIPTSILLITDVNGTKQTVDTKQYTTAGVTFRIDTSKAYSLTIRSQGYIPENRDITPNVADYMIFLEKETVSNISDINVSVVDEDNLPVIGGTLLIYDGNSNYQDTRFTSVVTDNNGTATFDNIPKGYYFIKLRKVNVINQSGKFTHNPPIDTNMVMTINIGEGTISFNIKNINQETIDFANVKIYDVIGNEIGVDQALQNGTYTRKIKADKVIYVKISKEGYLDYYTELLPIITNETITKEIRLNRVGTITTPTVELVGLYNQQDINASFLAQNSRYYFKFKLINPSAGNIGIRFVVGEQDTAEEDIVYIKPITNSKANISYYSNINLTAVQQDTFAKVIDATFINASQGVYEIQIPVSTVHALRGQAVPIYYSVFTGSPTSIDNLGNQRVYYIDVSEICSENFCISGQFVDTADDIVYDLEAGVNSLVVNKNYDFKYILTNAKSNVYTSNRLAITNVDTTTELETQAINILSYNIFGGGFLQTSTSGNQIRNKMPFTSDYLPSTQINVYDKINIDTTIKPVLLGTTRIQNKIISNQSVVYNEFINFNVAQEYPFTISYEPQNIVPGKPFTLTVTALDNSVLPVSGALVNIYQKLANNQQVTVTSGTYRTDDYGTVAIPIPALNNSEKIIISVEKSGYYAVPVEITINQDILSLKQGTAVVTETSPFIINVRKSNPEGSEKTITIINKTNYSLQLKPFRDDSFSFRYSNYINVSQLQQYLNSQVPSIIIPANGETDLDIKLSASQDTTNLTETLNITGNIIGYVTVDNSQAEYAFNIPMAVKVSVGEGVEEDDCLVVNGVSNPWQAVVSGNDTTSVSFDIVNNCKVKGNDEESITLKTLRAKMVNQKDQYGYYTLNVDGRTITLSEGSYTTLLNDLSPGVHSAILTYYSLDKKMGDIETKIYINAQIETDTGLKYVNTTKDIAFTTEIAIRKIEDCIDFYDGSQKINNMLVITKETIEGQSKEIVIKNNCSTLGTFKLSFCGEDKGYTGCQELRYSNMEGYLQNQLSFNLGTDSQTAGIIKPGSPGGYIIPVRISVLSDSGRAITTIEKRLKVNVHSASGLYMEDPFIEVEKQDEIYISQPVRLLNSDINTTPWDYATQKVGDEGFSKYMILFNSGDNGYKKMKFEQFSTLGNTNSTPPAGINLIRNGGILGVLTQIATSAGWIGPLITVSAAAFPFVLIGGLVGGAAAIAIPTFFSDYTYNPIYNTVNIEQEYKVPDWVLDKKIIITNSEDSQLEYLNIFDITGARYMTYLQAYGVGSGKLAKDKTLSMVIPLCNGSENKTQLNRYNYIINSKNCDSEFSSISETDQKATYDVKCSGAWPRKGIYLQAYVYSFCKYDTTIWPEQAGIKPLVFNISDVNLITRLEAGDIIYKNITFYPTLDDQNAGQDSAFVGSDPIGYSDFRFAIMSKQYPEKPQVDLNMVDCFTDSGKTGKTGEGALPKVKFDWTWNEENINDCSNGDQYCDATQLSQVIINRIVKADEQIKVQRDNGKISCPKSTSQVIDETLNENYSVMSSTPSWNIESVPVGYTGLQEVRLGTEGKLIKVKVAVENRTTTLQTGLLNIDFGSYTPVSYETLDSTGDTISTPVTTSTQAIPITIPADDTADYIFTYGTESSQIIANNIPLTLIYAGANTYTEDLGYTRFVSDINASVHEASNNTSCQVPATTAQFNGVDYIDMWFNKPQYPNNVVTEWDLETQIKPLKQTLEFDAYLITDNYNAQFLNDFDKAYGGKASRGSTSGTGFLSSPGFYNDGIYSSVLKDNTTFALKYSTTPNGVNILVPGLYKVRIDFIYNNEDWKLVNDAGDVDSNVTVTFTYIKGPDNDSVFYRMPFDGFVGQNNNNYSRQNYGLAYIGDSIVIDKEINRELRTEYSSSSNPKKYLNVQFNKDFFKANSNVETRGNILIVKEKQEDQIDMIYSPSVATPVLMSVTRTNLLPFTAYYQLKDHSGQAVTGGSSLGVWSGVSKEDPQYYDFSGDYVYSRFMNFYDRQTTPDERIFNSYAVDWDTVSKRGTVNLRTIFYTPYDTENSPITYTLTSKSRDSVGFYYNSEKKPTSEIKVGNTDNTIDSVNTIFEKVKTDQICVVNTENGKVTEFYWNPKVIYEINDIYNGIEIDGISD